MTSVEVADNVVYVGGHFRWLSNANGNDSAGSGAINRFGLGALDPINGLPLVWNPTRSGARGHHHLGSDQWELWRGSNGLLAGFDSDGLGNGIPRAVGLFPLAGGRTVAATNAPTASSGYLYVGTGNGQTTKVPFNGSTLGTPASSAQANLTSAGASFSVGNKLYWSKTDAAAPGGSYLGGARCSTGLARWAPPGSAAATTTGSTRRRWRGRSSSTVGCTTPRPAPTSCSTATWSRTATSWAAPSSPCPSVGLNWGNVRGLAWVNGKIVYGNTDGSLRAVPFDEVAVDGAASVEIAPASAGVDWSSKTLFFATS